MDFVSKYSSYNRIFLGNVINIKFLGIPDHLSFYLENFDSYLLKAIC